MSNSQIAFPVITSALGRNGTMKVIGLDITSDVEFLTLTPINTKNILGRCEIAIPKDSYVLRRLIETLQAEEAILLLKTEKHKTPFDKLIVGDSFNWRKSDQTPREFVKINDGYAAPKDTPDDHWSFRGECEVQPWPQHLAIQKQNNFVL